LPPTTPANRISAHGGERAIGVYVAAFPTEPDHARKLAQDAAGAGGGAALILPDEPLDAICYSCTSASVVIGDAEIEAAVQSAKPGVAVVTPPMAGVRGLRALGAKRISILTHTPSRPAGRWRPISPSLA